MRSHKLFKIIFPSSLLLSTVVSITSCATKDNTKTLEIKTIDGEEIQTNITFGSAYHTYHLAAWVDDHIIEGVEFSIIEGQQIARIDKDDRNALILLGDGDIVISASCDGYKTCELSIHINSSDGLRIQDSKGKALPSLMPIETALTIEAFDQNIKIKDFTITSKVGNITIDKQSPHTITAAKLGGDEITISSEGYQDRTFEIKVGEQGQLNISSLNKQKFPSNMLTDDARYLTAFDANGNEVDDVNYKITTQPEGCINLKPVEGEKYWLVSAEKEGTATITAESYGWKSDTITINVTQNPISDIFECNWNDKNKTATIVSFNDSEQSIKELSIPTRLMHNSEAYEVTSIADGAFKDNKILEKVVIPQSVKSIGSTLFERCENLKFVDIEAKIDSIPIGTFSGCSSLTHVYLSKTIKTIEQNAFRECESLREMVLPNTITYIDNYAFMDCSNLTSITLPKSLVKIGFQVFLGCSSLSDWSSTSQTSGVHFNGEAFQWGQVVKYSDWSGNESITKVTCLGDVDVSKNFESNEIRTDDFEIAKNEETKTAKITKYNPQTASEDGIVFVPWEINGYVVTEIGNNAFQGNNSICYVYIPSTIKKIGTFGFGECKNLKAIYLPNSVVKLEDYAFAYDDNLRSFTIQRTVTELGDAVFAWNEKLHLTYNGCVSNWGQIVTRGKDWHNNVLDQNVTCVDGVCHIDFIYKDYSDFDVELNKSERTATITKWNSDAEEATIPEYIFDNETGKKYYVNQIGAEAFKNNETIKRVNFPDTITSIGQSAFEGCKNLKFINGNTLAYISIDKSLTLHVAKWAFKGCALEKVRFIDGTVTIEEEAFQSCDKIEYVYFSSKIYALGPRIFDKCTTLPQTSIYDGVEDHTKGIVYDYNPEFSCSMEEWGKILHYGYDSKTADSDWNSGSPVEKIRCKKNSKYVDVDANRKLGDDYKYEIRQDGTVKLRDFKNIGYENITIPTELYDNGVVHRITTLDHTFNSDNTEGLYKIKCIVVPEGIEEIAAWVFRGEDDDDDWEIADHTLMQLYLPHSLIVKGWTGTGGINYYYALTDTSGPHATPGIQFNGTSAEWKNMFRYPGDDYDSAWCMPDRLAVSKVYCIVDGFSVGLNDIPKMTR